MKPYAIVFTARARQLNTLYVRIADECGEARADNYIEGIVADCLSLSTFPDRGAKRDDIRPNLRTKGYAKPGNGLPSRSCLGRPCGRHQGRGRRRRHGEARLHIGRTRRLCKSARSHHYRCRRTFWHAWRDQHDPDRRAGRRSEVTCRGQKPYKASDSGLVFDLVKS
jgi:plasmid stabilization system protein ParE